MGEKVPILKDDAGALAETYRDPSRGTCAVGECLFLAIKDDFQ